MIDLYYWPTPNGHKITLFLEETGLPYRIVPVDITAGDQFQPAFLAISPNNRMPAIVDHAPADGGDPLPVFESAAILQYLAEKSGAFLPAAPRARKAVLEWLAWQVGGFGPMLGQNHHFSRYAPEPIPYAIDRYQRETERLYRVLDGQLARQTHVAGEDLSIADFACHPWAHAHAWHHIDLADYPHVQRWHDALLQRPAFARAYALEAQYKRNTAFTDEQRRNLFGTPAKS